jgi:hypothetical protein
MRWTRMKGRYKGVKVISVCGGRSEGRRRRCRSAPAQCVTASRLTAGACAVGVFLIS